MNVTGADPDDEPVDDAVLRLVAERGGSISAEHGIGTAKRPLAAPHAAPRRSSPPCGRSRRALDPAGILNPNVLLPVT